MPELSTDHSEATLTSAHSHGPAIKAVRGYVASRADRPTSFDPADIPVPGGREEEWRFTPMKRFKPLFNLDSVKAATAQGGALQLNAPELPGVTVERVSRDDARLGTVGAPVDRTGVVAWAASRQATIITLTAGAELTEALRVLIKGADTLSDGAWSAPTAQHLLLRAEPGSKGTVILEHTGAAALTQTVEVVVTEGAELTLVTVQDWDDAAVHASNHRVRVEGRGTLKHVVVSLGGDVRICPDFGYAGEGGHVDSFGVYFTDTGQHQEHRPYVAHTEPHCYSRVTYKGALQGDGAHAVWVGDCLIGAAARGTDTYELNRNLVLTEGAKADSVPNLEIENGNIEGAGHASATGRFDDSQLFYLRSRGIPELEARRLVVLGFFNEIVQEIGVPEVEETLMAAIERELALTGLVSANAEPDAPAEA
ncbi:cysteine desulfurase activator complex subunit SufD [Actinomyces bovis]|uniref:Cysteine desulfurase activator complex subunit SufD n=1 Tax=Actinomyces bovis TaxID=1658 RepID=A0ABY1VT05_9ACTO|nr:SufD family Fe-S cluster assembly protein [Actinomyces bovis]SPT54163.1 cysteine desulfurase activator complex subunit SufD [Actinomyces bovis]VEG53569.1 cysteine desulfurase activator complex subunit SufD [Actinomyces israelii]